MNNIFGDRSFSDLLHTPFSKLQNTQTATNDINSFTVYDLGNNLQPVETLTLDSRIDDDSRIMFKTFETTLRHVFIPDMDDPHIARLQLAKSTYDYSQLVSTLSKILELELNNSVVQKIREMMGIEMPQYYKQIKPDNKQKYTIVFTNKDNEITYIINLNQEKDNKLKPLSLGDIHSLIHRFSDELNDYLHETHRNKDFNSLNNLIESLRVNRNHASHTSVLNEKDFSDFYANFCSLIRDDWFTIIMDIKEAVKRK